MHWLAVGLLFIALCSASTAAQTIGGRYTVAGTNPNGSPYRGTAEIIPLANGACRITWQVGTTWNGVCLVATGAVGAVYRSGNASGLAVYDLQPDGSLRGVWTLGEKTGTEILTPAK